MKKIISLILAVLMIASVIVSFTGSSVSEKIIPSLNISADNISYAVSDNLYGISFENKGNAVDGGIVSNLVNNNSFEYSNNPVAAWNISAENYSVMSMDGINEQNKNYLSVTVNGNGSVKNLGYTEFYNYKTYQVNSKKAGTADMSFKKNEIYEFTAYFKNVDYTGTITASLSASGNTEKYQFNIDHCAEWMPITLEIKSNVTADGALLLEFEGSGSFLIDQVTLVPMSSYGHGSEEWSYISLRSDLVQSLYDLSPSFIRFSAGELDPCALIEDIGSWKNTIGPLETRKQSFTHTSKNVFEVNSNSMGLYEYLLLCDNLDCLAIPVINGGIVTSKASDYKEQRKYYENGSVTEEDWQSYLDGISYRPGTEEFEQYIQDILDLIEYANGDETTLWGAKRIEDGHRESFNLQYIAIGNGDYGELYWRNFDAVYKAVQEKYPKIKIITCLGENTGEAETEEFLSKVNSLYSNAIIDEHYSVDGGKLFAKVHDYDEYERSGAQVIVSEYSVDTSVGDTLTKNNIWSAVENAAFLTGVEKNSDMVRMISYETPLAKINAQEKDTSLVWFDSQNIVLSPDYYMQMLFANNVGTNYISTEDTFDEDGLYRSVTVDTIEKVIYVKIVNSTKTPHKININIDGFKNINNPSAQYMTENFKSACNEPNEDLHVAPVQTELTVKDNVIPYDVGGYSINVIRIPYDTNDGSNLFELPETDLIVPFIPSFIGVVISCVLVAFILGVGAIILMVRLRHHKRVREKQGNK